LQSAELFTMTYGAIVAQMLKDFEDVDAVNAELDKMCDFFPPTTKSLIKIITRSHRSLKSPA
jgi:hypothetical protein